MLGRGALIAALAAVGLSAFAPAAGAARARSTVYRYLTNYYGTYSFRSELTSPRSSWHILTRTEFEFSVSHVQEITVQRGVAKKNTYQSTYDVRGYSHSDYVQPDGSVPPAVNHDCYLSSDVQPFALLFPNGGTNVDKNRPGPKDSPSLNIAWAMPRGGTYDPGPPKYTVTGTNCSGFVGAPSFVGWTGNGAPGAFTIVDISQEFRDAMAGTANIPDSEFKREGFDQVWRRDFKAPLSGTGQQFVGTPQEAHETVKATVDSHLVVRKIGEVNKVGALLLEDGLRILEEVTARLRAEGKYKEPRRRFVKPERLLLPYIGSPGFVTTDVQGRIVGQHGRRASAAAAKPIVLARGSGRAARKGPVPITLVLTPAGRRLLDGAAAIRARIRLSVRPRGSKRTLSRTRNVTIPATP